MSYNGPPTHPQMFRQDDLEFGPPVQYQGFPDYASSPDRYADSAAGETRPALYPSSSQIHPHPLFTRQHNTTADDPTSQNRPLDPHVLSSHHQVYQSSSPFTNLQAHHQPQHPHESPQSWPPYEQPIPQPFPQSNVPFSYAPYHTPPPFPNRLSPPLPNNQSFQFKGSNQSNATASAAHRMTLAGSLDPATGIFYRTPEHPRLRTAQACEKCRTRKAKCSGEHPACKRCLTRGLVCEYAKEGRVRGPNKPKPKIPSGGAGGGSDGRSTPKGATGSGAARTESRNRTSSANSSAESSDHPDLPPAVRVALLRTEQDSSPSRRNGRRSSAASRRNSLSMGENRSTRPRPPDLHLDGASNLYRISSGNGPRSASAVGGGVPDPNFMSFHHNAQGSLKGGIMQGDMGQQFQRNIMPQGTLLHTSSSASSLKRISRGMQGDQSTPLALPQSHNLVPVGMNISMGQGEHQMGEELVYPPVYYHDHHPQHPEDGGHSLPSSFSNPSVGASSPQTSISAETTSAIASPLTPSSASTPSLMPPGMLPGGGANMGLDFELDPQLAAASLPASQRVIPDGKQHHGDSPLAMHNQYHSPMDLHMR